MALSVAAYGNYTISDRDEQLSKLAIPEKIDNSDSPAAAALHSSLASWILIDFIPNTPAGFAAAAFRSPSGEIVFSFRGTDQWLEGLGLGDDVTYANLGIALQNAVDALPVQFSTASSFVNSVLNNSAYSGADYSFTGHSLGGALASYMTYVTNTDGVAGVGKAVTFNAPGIAGLLPDNVNPADYNGLVTDHVNQGDIVGEFRADEQLGRTVYQMRP